MSVIGVEVTSIELSEEVALIGQRTDVEVTLSNVTSRERTGGIEVEVMDSEGEVTSTTTVPVRSLAAGSTTTETISVPVPMSGQMVLNIGGVGETFQTAYRVEEGDRSTGLVLQEEGVTPNAGEKVTLGFTAVNGTGVDTDLLVPLTVNGTKVADLIIEVNNSQVKRGEIEVTAPNSDTMTVSTPSSSATFDVNYSGGESGDNGDGDSGDDDGGQNDGNDSGGDNGGGTEPPNGSDPTPIVDPGQGETKYPLGLSRNQAIGLGAFAVAAGTAIVTRRGD